MKLSTKDILSTIDLYSSSTDGPAAPDQDSVLLGMSERRTKKQYLLQGVPCYTLWPSNEAHHHLANSRHWQYNKHIYWNFVLLYLFLKEQICVLHGVILECILVHLQLITSKVMESTAMITATSFQAAASKDLLKYNSYRHRNKEKKLLTFRRPQIYRDLPYQPLNEVWEGVEPGSTPPGL